MSDKAKILIADDEASLRTLLRAVISAEDKEFEIIEAVDGDDAYNKIQSDKPDLVILDVMMPGQSGFEVCEKVKADSGLKETIILILTAKGQETDKEWANSVGADCFLTKPFSPLELLETVRELLKQKTTQ
ncbi:MAG: response regulator [Candidatus Melainabacteria bacterium]|nr:response regulator [Candidatus Melainabacteria bacterium]